MDYQQKLTGVRPVPREESNGALRDLVTETESDRGRVIQSAALRRLQQKTQVYPLETNAAVRSRLTHSLEVQQNGRYLALSILKRLAVDGKLESLGLAGLEVAFTNVVEVSCLLHDVGNPPFGHFGEQVIGRWVADHGVAAHAKAVNGRGGSPLFYDVLMEDLKTFEGNAQGVRIIHTLQNLNICWAQLAATIKYTRMPHELSTGYRQKKPGYFYSEAEAVKTMREHLHINDDCRHPLVYIMEAADDIAYCIADLEDAVDKGILSIDELCIRLIEVWTEFSGNRDYLPALLTEARAYPDRIIHRLRSHLFRDLVAYAANRYVEQHEAVFNGTLDEPLINGGSDQHLALKTLKAVAVRYIFGELEKETPELRGYAALNGLLHIYRPLLEMPVEAFAQLEEGQPEDYGMEQRLYHRLPKKYKQAYWQAVQQLNATYHRETEQLDLEWYYRCRLLLDYISGMTDHFVLTEYQGLSAI